VHVGSYETLPNSWRQLVDKELPESGHARRAGAGLEIYRNTPGTVPPEQLVTELYVPIE
jgi:AraC family transcriptional regulator